MVFVFFKFGTFLLKCDFPSNFFRACNNHPLCPMQSQPFPTLPFCCLTDGRLPAHCSRLLHRAQAGVVHPLIPKISIRSREVWQRTRGKPGFLFAMHSTCFLSGCKEPEQTFWAALRHVRGHISGFFLLIKNSSDGGVEEEADGGSRQGKYACDKQVNGNLCTDS